MKLSKMKKEELELLSYTNIAKLYLEENKVTLSTADLFKEICKLFSCQKNEEDKETGPLLKTNTFGEEDANANDDNDE